jgi:hypothetical protein
MQNRVGPRLDECSFDGIHISEVPVVQCNVRLLDRVLPDKPMDLVTVAAQSLRYVASNESCDARYQNALHRFVS